MVKKIIKKVSGAFIKVKKRKSYAKKRSKI